MLSALLKKIFGSKNDREIKQMMPIVAKINELEQSVKILEDTALREKTSELRERLSKGETLDDILPEAFAIVREASIRALGMRHFDVQLMGGIVLHRGKIAEMKTGEGKTLVATLPLYLNALTGKGAHLVTVNDYLARRDSEWMGKIYSFLGMSVGIIVHGMSDSERKYAYSCDITYGTNNEFGFDYLRDNMKYEKEDMAQRGFEFAIVDEVDSILIDEARTPLIISGPVEQNDTKNYDEVKPFVILLRKKQSAIIRNLLQEIKNGLTDAEDAGSEKIIEKLILVKRGDPKNPAFLDIIANNPSLKKNVDRTESLLRGQKLIHELDKDLYCIIDEMSNSIELTEKGINMLDSAGLGPVILPDIENENFKLRQDASLTEDERLDRINNNETEYLRISSLLHATQQLIRAYWMFEKDVHYVIKDNQIVIVDEFTGRMMPGRRWSDGLHQAVEAKEGVKVAGENQTLATITFQNFFRMYKKLAGMTGTADTEAEEFKNIYKLDVAVIPTNKPMIRTDNTDFIYKTEREKYNAAVQEIKELYEKGQPTLVGTISIEKSEMLSRMLKRAGIPHSVLNAKQHEKEAEIIANAGQIKTVTISTNMAGRGTDIMLGDGVKELGGLHVLGTERHESRRIDNQLRGRSGRQGDPGSSRFYLSLEDDLLRIFASDRVAGIMSRLGLEEGVPIEHPLINKAIENAQKKVEAHNFDIRKHLIEYDNVMNKHREIIYSTRNEIIEGINLSEIIYSMIDEKIEMLVEDLIDDKTYPTEWNIDGLRDTVARNFGILPPVSVKDLGEDKFHELTVDKLKEIIKEQVNAVYREKEKIAGEDISRISKFIMLQILDNEWIRHLQDMDSMKSGIGLRGYGQLDPLKEYQKEGFAMFGELMDRIRDETLSILFKIQVLQKPPESVMRKKFQNMQMNYTDGEAVKPSPVRRNEEKIGRNELCSCGSGKKYKKCCGNK